MYMNAKNKSVNIICFQFVIILMISIKVLDREICLFIMYKEHQNKAMDISASCMQLKYHFFHELKQQDFLNHRKAHTSKI